MTEFASSHLEWSYHLGMSFAKDLHLGTTGSPDLKNSCTNKSINALNEKKKSLHDKLTS